MKKKVFLFIFIFSLFIVELGVVRGSGNMERNKPMELEKPAPKTVKDEVVNDDSLIWVTARASYYNSRDISQTKKGCDGIGAFGRRIRSGSIAFGSPITESFITKKSIVFIQIKDCDVVTPYGKGIFRIDDTMAPRFNQKDKFFIDFYYKDISSKQKRHGVFLVKFRIYKIINSDGDELSPSVFFVAVQPLQKKVVGVGPLQKLSTFYLGLKFFN